MKLLLVSANTASGLNMERLPQDLRTLRKEVRETYHWSQACNQNIITSQMSIICHFENSQVENRVTSNTDYHRANRSYSPPVLYISPNSFQRGGRSVNYHSWLK